MNGPECLVVTLVNVDDLWHPALNPDSCVKNNAHASNLIVTGPNAGGKSTFIKALCLSVFMSQTIGVVASNTLELTPFYFINTQINIPLSVSLKSWDFELGYNLNIPNSLVHEDPLKTTSYFNLSVGYLFDFSQNK